MSATNTLNTVEERLRRWFPLTLAALGILAWSNVYSCTFIFDDMNTITDNGRLHRLWPPWDAVSVPTRFVAELSFALNHAIGGFNPADFHVTNLVIHIVAGLLLYGLVRRTLCLPSLADRFGRSSATLAFFVAALWLVHPLQTESVTYIVQREESLMGALFLAVFYAFVRSLDTPRPSVWRGIAWGLCLLGMGVKEIMVTAPVLLILFDGTFVADGWRDVVRQRGRFHAAMLATWAGFAVLFVLFLRTQEGGTDAIYNVAQRWTYLLTQSQAVLLYLRLIVIPWPLCLDYQWPLIETWREVSWQAPLVVCMASLAGYGTWRRKPWAFCIIGFFIILAPTSTLIPLPDIVFEHRMYLPLATTLALLILGSYHLCCTFPPGRARALRLVGGILLVIAIPILATMTWVRNQDYRTEATMWRDVIRKRPDNYRAYIAYSSSLLKDHQPAAALEVTQALLARLPDYTNVPHDELMRQWRAHLSMPVDHYAVAHGNLGAAYLALDRYEEALAQFCEAARVLPNTPWTHSKVAMALFFSGRTAAAIEAWRVALSMAPHDSQTLTFLAVALVKQGQDREAVERYREALRYSPGDPFVRMQLAWMLATHPDDAIRNGSEAVTVAEPLVEMARGLSARALDVMAAAQAEAGTMEAAIRTAEQALQLAGQESNPSGLAPSELSAATDIQHRLELYRAGKPYRATARPGTQE